MKNTTRQAATKSIKLEWSRNYNYLISTLIQCSVEVIIILVCCVRIATTFPLKLCESTLLPKVSFAKKTIFLKIARRQNLTHPRFTFARQQPCMRICLVVINWTPLSHSRVHLFQKDRQTTATNVFSVPLQLNDAHLIWLYTSATIWSALHPIRFVYLRQNFWTCHF